MKKENFNVYRMKDEYGQIIYVGKTKNGAYHRFSEHAKKQFWINDVEEVECVNTTSGNTNSIVETYHIATCNPIFNIDKQASGGCVDVELKDKYLDFTTSFYVLNGVQTSCPPRLAGKTKDDTYILVDIMKIRDAEVGIYYDQHFNIYYSVSDLIKAVNGSESDIDKVILKNKEYFKILRYGKTVNGKKIKQKTIIGAYESLILLTEVYGKRTKKYDYICEACKFFESYDLRFVLQGTDVKESADNADAFIRNTAKELDKIHPAKIKNEKTRRIAVYQSIKSGVPLKDIVNTINKDTINYIENKERLINSQERYAQFIDIANEAGTNIDGAYSMFSNYAEKYGYRPFKMFNGSFDYINNKWNNDGYKHKHKGSKMYHMVLEVQELDKIFKKMYAEKVCI